MKIKKNEEIIKIYLKKDATPGAKVTSKAFTENVPEC